VADETKRVGCLTPQAHSYTMAKNDLSIKSLMLAKAAQSNENDNILRIVLKANWDCMLTASVHLTYYSAVL